MEITGAAGAANGTPLAHAAADNSVRIRIEDAMADEEKDAKTAADEKTADTSKAKEKDAPKEADAEDAPVKKKSGVSPLVLILSAVGSLVVFVAVFSYTMGVF
ncbi:MAG TPA: hypothetical protein VM118_12670, partial [Acidobacteriota bacterium]|nr:hypothetical protein [Acidobacteriota bacterium]